MIELIPRRPLSLLLARATGTTEQAQQQLSDIRMRDIARIVRDALPGAVTLVVDSSARYVYPEGVQLHSILDPDDAVLWAAGKPLPPTLAAYRTADDYEWESVISQLEYALTTALGAERADAHWATLDRHLESELTYVALPTQDEVNELLTSTSLQLPVRLSDLSIDSPVFWFAQPVTHPTMTVAGVRLTVYRDPTDGTLTLDIGTGDAEPPLEIGDSGKVALDIRLNGVALYGTACEQASCRTDDCDGYRPECADRRAARQTEPI